MLQVQVHPIGVHFLRVFEHHGLRCGVTPPVPQLLARLTRRAEGIEHITPAVFPPWQLLRPGEDPLSPLRVCPRLGPIEVCPPRVVELLYPEQELGR